MQPRVKITDSAIEGASLENRLQAVRADEDVSIEVEDDYLAATAHLFPEWKSPEDSEAFSDL